MEKHLEDAISKLTLLEKAKLCSGKDFWHLQEVEALNLKSIMVTDGPHGLRKQQENSDHLGIGDSVPSTCFPTASALASSWDKELLYQLGEHLGDECLTERVSVLLGPGVNIKRHPLCGRNFEYFSEDPILSGKLASELIKGIQSKGVGTSLKHFVANNQEAYRMVVDAVIDQRTLRELYLKSFEIPVKEASPWTVMNSYNKVNGTYLSENKTFLTDILRNEWGFKGLVMTDWGACDNRVDGLIAGQDLEMPGSGLINTNKIIKQIKSGQLDETVLDVAVSRNLDLIMKSNDTLNQLHTPFDKELHHQFARQVAAESTVLLKNNNGILPFKKTETIALIGAFAKTPRYQGSGSSLINPTKIGSAFDEFSLQIGNQLLFAQGYHSNTEQDDEVLIQEALQISSKADKVILMVGLTANFESEGFDRTHLSIPKNHLRLINEISKIHKHVVVALSNGSPINMPWIDQVDGIIESYLGGQASGEALYDIVYGVVNPSGKLAETFPNQLEEFPSNFNFPGDKRQVIYAEGLYVGYRYYDTVKKHPLFPFGYGLSYTTFSYHDLNVEVNNKINISLKVTNTGKVSGKEIVQVYVSKSESAVYRPQKDLKAFSKIYLTPGETKEIALEIEMDDLKIYNDSKFRLEAGNYEILVGSSSKNILLEKTIQILSEDIITPAADGFYTQIDDSFHPTKHTFGFIYNEDIPDIPPTKPYHMNSTLEEIRHTLLGKIMYKMILKQSQKMLSSEALDETVLLMFESMVREMPFRNVVIWSNGTLSENVALGLLDFMNKKPLKGLKQIVFKK